MVFDSFSAFGEAAASFRGLNPPPKPKPKPGYVPGSQEVWSTTWMMVDAYDERQVFTWILLRWYVCSVVQGAPIKKQSSAFISNGRTKFSQTLAFYRWIFSPHNTSGKLHSNSSYGSVATALRIFTENKSNLARIIVDILDISAKARASVFVMITRRLCTPRVWMHILSLLILQS